MAVSRERVVQSAEKYVSRGKIESAIKEYRKLLAENPNDISTLNRVGDLYARINRNSEAIDLFTQIAEQYAEDGFFVKAIAIYKKIIKIDPTLLEVYEQLADLYHRQGLVNEARTQYQVLADYYLKHDRTGQAISIYRRMAQLEPDDPSNQVKLAELYQQEGRTEDAMGAYRAIADLMLEHGRGVEAARVYERALDVDAQDLGFVTDAVLKLKERGHVAAAASFLSLAVDRNPNAERVAKIVGLESRPSVAAAAAEEAPPTEAPVVELTDDPATVDVSEALAEAEAAVSETPSPEMPSPETPFEEPAAAEMPADAAGGFEIDDLEPQAFEFDLDLDDDTSASLVTPPADMLEDRDRRGAAWGETDEPPPPKAAEATEAPEPAAAEVESVGGEPVETDAGTFELELDLEGEEPPAVEASDTEPAELDHDLLERTAAEVYVRDGEEVEDLLTEAEVLARYGIEEKALERLAELLQREPHNLQGYELMVGLHLDAGRHARVVAIAGRMAEVAAEVGDEAVWPGVRERMVESGYTVEGDGVPRIEAPAVADLAAPTEQAPAELAGPAPISEEDLDLDLDADLLMEPEAEAPAVEAAEAREIEPPPPVEEEPPLEEPEIPEEPPVEEPPPIESPPVEEPPPAESPPLEEPPKKRRDVDSILAQLSGQFLGRKKKPVQPASAASAPPPAASEPAPPPVAPPSASAPPPAAGGRVDPLRALGDSLRAEIDDTAGVPAEAPPPAAASAEPAPSLDDTGVSWLDEVAAAPPADADAFAEDDDFFDLGAELEQELSAEEQMDEDLVVVEAGEQSLEEIVEGFKRGVAENLSPEDFDTHFNLGIAYREMGLLDEAIGEFQLAAREPAYTVSCASMLGLCFTEKGLPELAVKWYKRGLDAPGVSDDDRAGLLYDLGEALVAAGDRMAAYHTFVDLYGINTNYRDVVARLTELEPVR